MTSRPSWSDERMVQRMSSRFAERYPQPYWDLFESVVQPRIGSAPSIADLGCGPGLLLQELARRIPCATLTGVDASDEMLASAGALDYGEARPAFLRHDLNEAPYPLDDGTVDLCSSANVVCFLDNPLVVLGELRRVLVPDGVYLLYDWKRQALADYVRERGEDPAQLMGLQAYHNRFTTDDWRWLLNEGGFDVIAEANPRITHVALACAPR